MYLVVTELLATTFEVGAVVLDEVVIVANLEEAEVNAAVLLLVEALTGFDPGRHWE